MSAAILISNILRTFRGRLRTAVPLLRHRCTICRLSCVAALSGLESTEPPSRSPEASGESVGSRGNAIQFVSGVVGRNNLSKVSSRANYNQKPSAHKIKGWLGVGQWSPLTGACSSRLTLLAPSALKQKQD